MSDPSYTPPEAPADYEQQLAAIRAWQESLGAGTQTARPRNYQLGVVGAFILVAATAALMAFPLGLACAGAWWIFTAGWNVVYG